MSLTNLLRDLITNMQLFNNIQHNLSMFIKVCCVTEAFRTRDTEQIGTITIGFEDFLGVALSCSI